MQHNNNPQLQQYLNHRSQQLPMAANTGTRSDPYTAYATALMSNQLPIQQSFQQQQPTQQQQHEQVQHKLAQLDEEKIYTLVLELLNPNLREQALLELSKKREQYEDLALILWHSFGVMSALLQEIVSVYPLLAPPSLTGIASNRVCNALALLQCVASHQETRTLFLNGMYACPLLIKTEHQSTVKLTVFGYLPHDSTHPIVLVPILEYHQQD
ncbi:hypothetical protein NQZ79_g5922 [Umbelopsis isabellina]|nr:hypothetical protein NQZ79_g5922 [Umbelopsis isabellina]